VPSFESSTGTATPPGRGCGSSHRPSCRWSR
jgi:hypothetical protein